MCEFCTEHAEGKKWYLEMKNYSDELLHEELHGKKRDVAGTNSRIKWLQRFFENFIIPAVPRASTAEKSAGASPTTGQGTQTQPSEQDIVAARKIVHFGQVLPIEDVEEVINMVNSITRMPCGCRYMLTGKSDQRYCFGFALDRLGILGKFPDAASSFEVLDKEKVKKIFREYDAEGLVHSIWTGVTPYILGMCNCDRDCGAYRGYIYAKGPPSFFRAEYVCQVNIELCNGCKSCMSQCQFGAQFYSSALARVYIDPARCFGCGVCRASCPTGAINILPRQSVPAAAGLWLKNPAK
jgi:ferredoxin